MGVNGGDKLDPRYWEEAIMDLRQQRQAINTVSGLLKRINNLIARIHEGRRHLAITALDHLYDELADLCRLEQRNVQAMARLALGPGASKEMVDRLARRLETQRRAALAA